MESNSAPGFAVSGEIYGVSFLLEADAATTLGAMVDALGPPWTESKEAREPVHLRVTRADDETHLLERDGQRLYAGSLDSVLETVGGVSRRYVAFHAPEHLFIHAGCVAHAGRALIAPGDSFSGKSTLVTALVKAGATYFSDEYAVLDAEGLVHPYHKPIALREQPGSAQQTSYRVDELGGRSSGQPVPLGLVVVTQYRHGARWAPAALSSTELVIEMFGNTYLAADRPEQTLRTLRAATTSATGIKGERGEASDVVAGLLACIAQPAARDSHRG